MGIYLGNIDLASAGGGSAGGAIPQTEIFTSSGTWLVPQDVQDKITNDGHADIGIIAVGGGNQAGNICGEVKNEILKITSATYSPSSTWANSNQPEINVTVGAIAGDSGIGYDTATANVSTGNFTSNLALTSNTFSANSNNQILVKKVGFLWGGAYVDSGGYSYNGTDTPATFVSGGQSSLTYVEWANDGTYLDGTVYFNGTRAGSARYTSISWNTSNNTFTIGSSDLSGVSWYWNITYKSAPGAPTIKAESGDGTVANFRNNPTSTEGYLGFSRFNSTRPGSAGSQGSKTGYVQIFF